MAKKPKREPKYLASPLNNAMLNYREYYMSAGERLLYSILVFAGGAVIGWAFYGGLFMEDGKATTATLISNAVVMVVVGAIALKVFMPAVTKRLKQKRAQELSTQFRDMLESLTSSLSSGGTVVEAFQSAPGDLRNQYGEDAYIIVELNEIISGMANGQNLETMLKDFGDRSDNEDILDFSNVISNCYRMGGDFKSVVRKTKDVIGDKMAIASEIETKLSSNKLQHNAMCIIPIILIIMLKQMSSMFAENLASPIGVIATTVGVILLIISYFWGKKIIDIK